MEEQTVPSSPWSKYPWFTRLWLSSLVIASLYFAFDIRTFALNNYGYVIHEFDPWFNYRATEYLEKHGLEKFFTWFDHRAWYPLGRPVGTTIYPGMQMTSVVIYRFLTEFLPQLPSTQVAAIDDRLVELHNYTLNDVCCLVPCWFGVLASGFTGLLAYESTGNNVVGGLAVFFMSIIPAHIMRSVGGGYDNESVAVSALTLTFYLWVRSMRSSTSSSGTTSVSPSEAESNSSNDSKGGNNFLTLVLNSNLLTAIFFGSLTGLSYVYMVAAWGGYIFVLNMISFHAFYLCFISDKYHILSKTESYSYQLFISFACFYVIGTFGAIQIPVVGLAPLKSLEQLFGLAVFFLTGIIAFAQTYKLRIIASIERKYGSTSAASRGDKSEKGSKSGKKSKSGIFMQEEIEEEYKKFLFGFGAIIALFGALVIALLYPTGYFGPLSSRIRGLFVPHTRTGNPLVDSVAEHRAASPLAFFRYLHICLLLGPIGAACMKFRKSSEKRHDQHSFLLLYAGTSYYFSSKMVRLIILLGPIISCLSGVAIEAIMVWCHSQLYSVDAGSHSEDGEQQEKHEKPVSKFKKDLKAKRKKEAAPTDDPFLSIFGGYLTMYNENPGARKVIAGLLVLVLLRGSVGFFHYCYQIAEQTSHPSLMFKAKDASGEIIIIDDYREAYWWLRDSTPYDARVMAWWDYGYQISGIADRITIADGNTWNHEHIATLGRCLVSEEKSGHEMIKHLADYVLVWAGGRGDDLAKSPHIARIANSVYSEVCGVEDPLCKKFGFHGNNRNNPTEMMKQSVIFKLHSGHPDPALWELVYTSKHRYVKIWKVKSIDEESKEFGANEMNYLCDNSGWLCRGQYPPKFRKYIQHKKDFKQLEDFNVKGEEDEQSKEYQKKYHEAFTKK